MASGVLRQRVRDLTLNRGCDVLNNWLLLKCLRGNFNRWLLLKCLRENSTLDSSTIWKHLETDLVIDEKTLRP